MRLHFVFPGSLDTPTGGYRYDREIIGAWRKTGIDVNLISLPGGYPFPKDDEKTKALSLVEEVNAGDVAVVDGLAGGCHPELMAALSKKMRLVALVHHPLCLEAGLNANEVANLEAREKEGLSFAKAVVTTSPATKQTVQDLFDITEEKVHTVLPGVVRAKQIAFRKQRFLNLLSIGSISERKGHDVLLEALATLKDLSWHLDVVGPTHFDQGLFDRLKAIVEENGLSDRVTFNGAVEADALDGFYQGADIFALASRYEGYGMVFSEAIVRGIPVVSTTAGAIPDTVPEQAGLLVEPDDVSALAAALRQLMEDDNLRREKHEGALASEPSFPTWAGSAARFLDILRAVK